MTLKTELMESGNSYLPINDTQIIILLLFYMQTLVNIRLKSFPI